MEFKQQGGDHRAPADGAIGSGHTPTARKGQLAATRAHPSILAGTSAGDQLWPAPPPYGLGRGAASRTLHAKREPAEFKISGCGHYIGFCPCQCSRERNMRSVVQPGNDRSLLTK